MDLNGLASGVGEGGTNDAGVWIGISAWVERSTDEATVDASGGSGAGTADEGMAAAGAGGAAAARVAKIGLLIGDAAAPTDKLRAVSTGGDAAGGSRDRSECRPDGI